MWWTEDSVRYGWIRGNRMHTHLYGLVIWA
ncbi:hypothetical protein BJ982_003060 [Sphaerisporangium siamense]|uniref:Uncharacterized protein n=1 Tax=Sphaerisporangium siamense TaxID=795645 RepID=A0A7W7GC04_9ACTN|nr:hypothetical protein [Sphaerisporangium siamense]